MDWWRPAWRGQLGGARAVARRRLAETWYRSTTSFPWRRRPLLRPLVSLLAVGSALLGALALREGLVRRAYVDAERACAVRPGSCALGLNLVWLVLTTLVISAVVTGWSGWWVRRRRAGRSGARPRHPRAPSGPVSETEGMRHLSREMLRALADGVSGPLVLVGPSGAGKSTFVDYFADRLAALGAHPILVDMNDRLPGTSILDVASEIAVRSLESRMDVATAQRAWGTWVRRRRAVLLVDGVDEMAWGDMPTELRQEFLRSMADAAAERLPTLVCVRPENLPPPGSSLQFVHPPPDLELAVGLANDLGPAGHALRADAAGVPFEVRQLMSSPLYVFGLQQLSRRAGRDEPLPVDRRTVLSQLVGNELDDIGATAVERRALVKLALSLLRSRRYSSHATPQEAGSTTGPDASALLLVARRSWLVGYSFNVDGFHFRFHHAEVLAWFAAEALAGGTDDVALLGAERNLPELFRALELARPRLVSGSSPVGALLAALDEHLQASGPTESIRTIRAMLSLAETGDPRIGRWLATVDRLWPDLTLNERLGFLDRLDAADETQVVGFLWRHCCEDEYAVRWKAASVMARAGQDAPAEVLAFCAGHLDANAKSITDGPFDPLTLGERSYWVLPSLSGTEAGRQLLDRAVVALEHMLQDEVPASLGVESSLAQGVRLAASLPVEAGIDHSALLELGGRLALDGRFWYSRTVAAQAVSLLGARTEDDEDAAAVLDQIADQASHQLVRAAATLGCKSLRDPYQRTAWTDEAEAIRTLEYQLLTPEATLLLAEVTVLLNLSGNERDQARRDQLAVAPDLPPCLVSPAHRDRLIAPAGADDCCDFRLCPYLREAPFRSHRGELSATFIRTVETALRRHGAPVWYGGKMRTYLPFLAHQMTTGDPAR